MRPAIALLVLAVPTPCAAHEARLIARESDGTGTTGPLQRQLGERVEVRVAILEPDGRVLAAQGVWRFR